MNVILYSTRDTETTRLGSWADQRYRERSNEQAKYQSISPLSIHRRIIPYHIGALADPVTDRTSDRLSPANLKAPLLLFSSGKILCL